MKKMYNNSYYYYQSWIYELVYEHMTSPIWKIAISEYIDENCIFFEDDDSN